MYLVANKSADGFLGGSQGLVPGTLATVGVVPNGST